MASVVQTQQLNPEAEVYSGKEGDLTTISVSAASRGRSTRLEVLAIIPDARDFASLQFIMLGHTNWNLHRATDLPTALSFLAKHPVPVVLCSKELNGATWKDMLKAAERFPNPQAVLVNGVKADDGVGMEVLNSGGYDLLRSPFITEHVLRAISLAGRRWHDEARAARDISRVKAAS